MKATTRVFWILGVFFALVAAGYGIVTGFYEPMGIEFVGLAAVIALSILGFMIAMFLTLTGRSHSFGSADSLDGEVDDEPGVQGSFSPYSWAPLWASLGAALVFLGVAAGWWIFAFGILFAAYGILLWVLEFSRGQHAH